MKITKLFTLSILALTSLFILSGCNTQTVAKWDTITVSYEAYLQDDKAITSWEDITFTVWMGETFPIFDTMTIGMKKWESKSFTATVEEWYGIYHDANKVQNISTTIFNKIWTKPQVWKTIELGDMKGLVLQVWPMTNKIDFNEPQTREPVKFKIKIVDIAKTK